MEQRESASDEEAKALASSLRLRILRICMEAHTNKEIAEILGRDPASILHHIRRLVRTGFLQPQPERRGARGAREVPYLATGKSWRVSAPATGRTMLEAFLEEIALVAGQEADTARLGLRLSPSDFEEFRNRLLNLLEEAATLPQDPSAPAWSLFVALHPDPNRP